jgi:multiple antibiotic resistance protein
MHWLYKDIGSILETATLVLAALFPIVNPIGSAAVFLAMIPDSAASMQKVLAQKISVYSFFLLFLSMLFGGKVLSFFGVSLYAVQIGGGIIVAITGFQMLNKDAGPTSETSAASSDVLDHAFYPYTLPITVGPGSISVAVALGAHLPSQMHLESVFSVELLIAALLGVIAVCAVVFVCYRWARDAERLLGKSGTTVLMKLSSFILMCIGVQILCSGVHAFLTSMHIPH